MKSETKKLFLRLKQLSADIRRNTYESIKVSSEILADHDCIAELYDGDDDKAIEAIEGEYFSSLHGYVTLGTLLAIYRHFPLERQWQEYRYDLRAMELLWKRDREQAQGEDGKRTINRVKKTDLDAALEKVAHLEAQLRRTESEAAGLRAENERLSKEVARLTGRIEAFESMRRRELVEA